MLETTLLDHGEIPTGFARLLVSGISLSTKVFSRHFISFQCQISILCCGCSYFPLGKGYLSLILCPLSRGFEWFLFVRKNNSPWVSWGSTHGEENDKRTGDKEDVTDVTSSLNLTVIKVSNLVAQLQKYTELNCHDFEDYRWLRVPAWLWHMPKIYHAPLPSLFEFERNACWTSFT